MTDITYIRTHEGWLYLAIVIDLFFTSCYWLVYEIQNHDRFGFRCIIDGFVAKKLKEQSPIHSDQGSQYTTEQWLTLTQTIQVQAQGSANEIGAASVD